jgi:hypothetical protein
MAKNKQVGIPVDGGVITLEPGPHKVRFWLRELFHSWIWNSPVYTWDIVSSLFIVVWNADRSVEFYREGPYRDPPRGARLASLQAEITQYGLQDALFKRRSVQMDTIESKDTISRRIRGSRKGFSILWRAQPKGWFGGQRKS